MADLPPGQQTLTIEQALELGVQHHNAGRLPESESIYQQILQAYPNQPVALHMLGTIALQVGKNDIAIDLTNKALAIRPDFAESYYNLGAALQNLNKLDEAVENYKKAIAIKPKLAEAHGNLGITLQALNRLDEAEASYKKALAINPNFAEAHNNLGTALKDLGSLKKAVFSYRKAIKINPNFAEAHSNLGQALTKLGMLDDAVASFRQALAINPNYPQAYNNLGTALKDMGLLGEAESDYRKAVAIKPDFAQAHLNLSFVLLTQGKLTEGWEEYEWRSKIKLSESRISPAELWRGSPLQGKSILVYTEQGIGDEIAFSSCIGDLLDQSPQDVFLECDPRLEALFTRSFSGVQVHGKKKDMDLSWLGENPRPDYALPIGSLPKFFRNRVEDFPKRDAYLTPHPKLVEKWKQRLASLKGGLKIGISWRGGTEANVIKRASIPLPEWRPLLSMNASFINLQYGDVTEEIAKLGDLHIHDWDDNDPLKDLDNQAALISCLDLVITIDNATVHMCGAIGTSTWALLEQVPDWRWPEAFGDSTPLYQSVRLFRQKRFLEWGDVMERVAQDLKNLVGNDHTH